VLRAPIDGVVLLMHAVPGEVVKTDESLVTVGDNTTVWVWADPTSATWPGLGRGDLGDGGGQGLPGDNSRAVDFVIPMRGLRTVKLRVGDNPRDGLADIRHGRSSARWRSPSALPARVLEDEAAFCSSPSDDYCAVR
jgi:hypothetical protein